MSSGLKGTSSAVNKYTGNAGYQNSLEQATKGAQVQANANVAQQKNALRNAGQSNAGAAILASQNVANQYNNAFNNQQSQAANMGQNAVNSKFQLEQQQYQNNWNNVGQGLQLAGTAAQTIGMLSDENCKDKINLTKADEYIKKHTKKSLKDMKLERKDNE
jgi:hypothetical protein